MVAAGRSTVVMGSKLADSPYGSTRNRNLLKVKYNKQQEFVIVGYTPSSKGLPGFASLVLGVYEGGKWVYAGRVGTGFTLKLRSEMQKQLDKFAGRRSPSCRKLRDSAILIGPSQS